MASSGIVEIQMPQMGESVTEGTVLEWHKREGEFVEEGETVVEVSTDKVDAEVPAPASGTITKILKGEDETIEVGAVLAELDPTAAPSGDGASAEEPAAPSGAPEPAGNARRSRGFRRSEFPEASGGKVLQITMPEMGESVTEGTILEWHKNEGDQVEEGETVVEVSTDKVDAEVPAPASGTIAKIHAQVDETVQVGQVLAEMSASGAPAEAPAAVATAAAKAPAMPAEAPTEGDGRARLAGCSTDRRGQRSGPERRQGLRAERQGHQGGRAGCRRRERSGAGRGRNGG